MMRAVVLAAMALAVTSPAAHAANARDPYGNVDRRNDAGNYTGNSETDRLNDAQLRGARGLPPAAYYRPPPPGYYRAAPPRYYRPPGYYAAPGYYAPPPAYYRPPPGYYRRY